MLFISFQLRHQLLKSKDINTIPKWKYVKIRILRSLALCRMQSLLLKFNGFAVMWNTNQVWIYYWIDNESLLLMVYLYTDSIFLLSNTFALLSLRKIYLFSVQCENVFVVCCFNLRFTRDIDLVSIEECNVQWIW